MSASDQVNNINETQARWRYHFIHNVYASFFNDILDYFGNYLYPRFQYQVVGTYDKAVEYIRKCQQYDRETDQPMLPALILNPTGDFDVADGNAGGKQLWRFPNLAYGFNKRWVIPVYKDENMMVSVAFLRMRGEIELIMLLNSFYEYCDVRMLLLNIFGGRDRIIYPRFFNSFIILPEELVNYRYTNEYTGVDYTINWESAGAYEHLVKTTAKNELVVPVTIKPQISLTAISDGSTRYGGSDKLAEWRLSATINYEVELPNYFILFSDYLAQGFDFEIRYLSNFSEYNAATIPDDKLVPADRIRYESRWDWGLDSTANSEIVDPPPTPDYQFYGDLVYKTRYFHTVTQSEVDSTSDLEITIPERITDIRKIMVSSKFGLMDYGDHYTVSEDGYTLTVRRDSVNLEVGWILELHIYERTEWSSSSSSVSSSSSSRSSSSSSSMSFSSSSSSSSSSSRSISSSSSSSSSSSTSASQLFKYFIGNVDAPYTPATLKGGWEKTTGYIDRKLVSTRADNGIDIFTTVTSELMDSGDSGLIARFISDEFSTDILFDQTDPAEIIIAAWKSDVEVPSYLEYYLYVTQGDSDLVRGVIFSNVLHSSELTVSERGWGYSNNFIGFNALAGDRLVLEIGYRDTNLIDEQYFHYTYIRYGGTSTTDLVDGSTYANDPGTISFTGIIPV